MRFEVAPDLPLARFCTMEHEAEQRITMPWHSGGMAAIINLQSTLKNMEKVLSERLSSSQYQDIERDLIIDTDIGAARLSLHLGGVSATPLPDDHPEQPDVAIPQSALAGMILGLYYPSHIWELWGRPISEDVLSLLTVLFPKRFPRIPLIDHF